MNINSQRLRDTIRETTRNAILTAAETVFAREILSVRMEDIAAEAGVAIGTLYNYFSDRKALLDTILETRKEEADRVMKETVEQTKGQPIRLRLEAIFQSFFDYTMRHHAFFHSAWQQEEVRTALAGKRPILTMMKERLTEIIRESVDKQELRIEYIDLYPAVIVGLMRGILSNHALGEPLDIKPNTANLLVSLFLEGADPRNHHDS